MRRYNDTYTRGFVLEGQNEDIVFGTQSSVLAEHTAIMVAALATNAKLDIGGRLFADRYGIYSAADDTSVTIRPGAMIVSETGASIRGDNLSLTNKGCISAEMFGVEAVGKSPILANHGYITGEGGIYVKYSGEVRILNGRAGEILADVTGIVTSALEFNSESELINLGSIVSHLTAISCGSGINDTVINRGLIVGAVALGDGNDRFDGRGGTLDGSVFGGDDDDLYMIDDSEIEIVENEFCGTDSVVSSVGFTLPDYVENLRLTGRQNIAGSGNDGDNRLVGNAGNNRLTGYSGNDVLSGLGGNDDLYGGGDQDTFVFRTGGGHDIVADFQDGIDRLDLRGWKGLDDLDEVLSHARDRDGDLIVSHRGDQLVIENFTRAQLDANDFAG